MSSDARVPRIFKLSGQVAVSQDPPSACNRERLSTKLPEMPSLAPLAFLLIPLVAAAQPSVTVRSTSRIELRTQRHEDHVVIEGALRDDLGSPLAASSVVFRAIPDDTREPSVREVLRTDAEGRFDVRLPLTTGGHLLRATFTGDPLHDHVEVERRLDLDRADVRLRVGVPDSGHIDLDEQSHEIVIVADSDEGGDGLGVSLLDELDRTLARGHTGEDGRVVLQIASADIGPPGAGRIKARSLADTRRAEAQTEVPIVRFRTTSIELSVSREAARPGDAIRLSGALSDSRGPIEGRAVGLFARAVGEGGAANEEHLRTVLTDREGTFVTDVSLDADDEGMLEIVGRYESDSPGRASSESPPVRVAVSAAQPTPWPWLLLPLALSGAALFLIARRAPKRPEKSVAAPQEKPIGVEAGRKKTLRADRDDLGGVVLDHRDDAPIAGARAALLDGGARAVREAWTDDSGAFTLDRAAPGTYTLSVAAEGYAPSRSRVSVPHRGEWSAATVRLESLRSRALSPYRPVAAELLPSPRLWGIWTQREVLDQARAKGRANEALEALSGDVERAYYGSATPTEADVERITEDADAALRSLRGAAPDS